MLNCVNNIVSPPTNHTKEASMCGFPRSFTDLLLRRLIEKVSL
jgi:hypothetical protein